MDKINKFKMVITSCLQAEANEPIDSELAVPRILSIDSQSNRFLLLAKGWRKKRYIHYIIYHIEIINDKIWIHEDRSDTGIANVLVDLGIEKSNIVLGYLPAYARAESEFAA